MEVLEREISRRLSRKHLRKRPVTLIELILVLKEAERAARRRRRSSQEIAESMISAEDVVSIAHEERYFEAAFTVMTCWDEEGDATLVSTLAEIAKRLGWKVQDVYIPLLFLMFEGKVELSQDEIFGELNVTRCRAAE
jgi:segregation and condensation protein A